MWWKVIVAALVVAGLGLWLYSTDRTAGDTWHSVGTQDPDRIDVSASVQRVDAVAREVVLRVLVVPHGKYGEDDSLAPREELRLLSSSSLRGDQVLPAHQRISSIDLPMAMSDGAVTDYPFDRYDAKIQFIVTQRGEQVPTLVTLDKVDSLFTVSVRNYDLGGGLDVRFTRSTTVLVFATFMMVTMWALAIAALLGARFLVSRRKGVVWPAFGFMAATLFALAGFRNAAPGSPPIGSLLDYIAFLWAEAIIALSVVVAVVAGVIVEPSPARVPPSEPTP